MGIVAFCPQGHRVKVKDELAGRKGICPQCGGRFRIPLESAAQAASATASPAIGETPSQEVEVSPSGLPVARVVSLDGDLAASLPRALPLAHDAGTGGG